MLGLGVDMVEVDRFRRIMRESPALVERVLTAEERVYARRFSDPAPSVAARFAAKEAVMKALGVGLGAFEFHDVEVVKADSGAPALVLSGAALELSDNKGITRWMISLSHTDTAAIAVVTAE